MSDPDVSGPEVSDLISRRAVVSAGAGLTGALAVGVRPAAADQQGDRLLRVMTWNIHTAAAPDNPGVVDLPRIVAVIRAESPDIVVLNEVHQDPDGPLSHGDQPAALAALLEGDGYSHVRFGVSERELPHGDGVLPGSRSGNLILSRHRFVGDAEVIKLPNENYEPGGKDRRSLIVSTVDLPRIGPVRVHGTHLSTPASAVLVEDQKEQVRIILDHVDSDRPGVLAGDFNIRVTDVAGQDFSQNNLMQSWIADHDLADTWRQVNDSGAGPTFSNSYGRPEDPHPDRRIDYVFATPWLEPVVGHVSLADRYASDHLAVIMDLRRVDARKLSACSVLAGPDGLHGWAQLTTTSSGKARLSVCKNHGTAKDDGTTVRARILRPSGQPLRTVVDGGTSRDRCTVESWSDRVPPNSTLEVCLMRGDVVLDRRAEKIRPLRPST